MPRQKKETTEASQEEVSKPTEIDNTIGPQKFERDDNGLLKNIQYVFNEDGSVNWRAMVGEIHLLPNKDWFKARNKDVPKSVEGLEDNQLMIKLSGIKELAKLRGFSKVDFSTEKNEHGYVAVKCTINWLPNYETICPVEFSDQANATVMNTSSFTTKFLETIACNRAFVRAVRNFLGIHIVGDDEIDKSNKNYSGGSSNQPTNQQIIDGDISLSKILEGKCEKHLDCPSFSDFKNKLREFWKDGIYKNEKASEWESYADIPAKEIRKLLVVIKNYG